MDIVGQRLDASKAQALVANALADFLVAGPDVADRLEVRGREGPALVRNEERPARRPLDDKADRDLASLARCVRVMGILEQLEENAVPILGSDDVVEAFQALVDLELATVGVEDVLQL